MTGMTIDICRRRLGTTLLVCAAVIVVTSCATTKQSAEKTVATNSEQVSQTVVNEPVVNTSSSPAVAEVTPESAPDSQPAPTQATETVVQPVVSEPQTTVKSTPVVTTVVQSTAAVKKDQTDVVSTLSVPQNIPPNTFLVTAAPKQTDHLYYGVGHNIGLVVNGESGKELVVVRGQTYTFDIDTGVQHDFYLSTSPKGWGASTFTDGVKGNFTYKGEVTFSPTDTAPDVVYYQCRNHKNMGSKIHVVNKGQEDKVVFGVKSDVTTAAASAQTKSAFTGGNQAKQKLMFAEMFIASSPASKRIDASENSDAKQLLADARTLLAKAKIEQTAGKDADAIGTVDEALRNMTEASQLVPSEAEQAEQHARYDELLHAAQTYEKSYARNYKMMQKKGKKDLPDLKTEQVSAEIAEAEKLGAQRQYAAANKKLSALQRTITGALTHLLADQTMDYTLTFDTPKEEYEYELSRYKSFEELIPIAIEQKQPSKQSLSLMDSFVDKAKGVYELSGPKAKEGDYKTAIQMLQGATSNLERALRIVGVR